MVRLLPIDNAPVVALKALASSESVTLAGSGRVERLKHYLVCQFALGGRRVQFLCGDNRFDPLLLARMARAQRADDEELLSAIQISRAFTAYQMCELVLALDTSLVGQLVVVSNPLALFADEDLRSVEAARFFYRMLWHMVGLGRGGLKFLITHSAPRNARRAYMARDLLRASETVMHFGGGAGFALERKGGAGTSRLALPRPEEV